MPVPNPSRAEIVPGRYLYRMPDWHEGYEVQVEQGQGRQRGHLTVRHFANSQASLLADIPQAAIFAPLR